jgi:DUF4097 and DUF4098 domain-containing protein YvlB
VTPRRLIFLTVVLVVLAAACSSASTAEQEFTETPEALTITSGTGDVSVTASDAGATVAAEIDDGCGERTDCEVHFVITVAGTADVAITTTDGAIAVVDMNSRVEINGAARTVSLNGITGPIGVDIERGDLLGARLVATDASFRTGEGDLDVTLTESFTSLAVVSGSGDVTAQVPDGDYNLDASTGSGAVDVKVGEDDGAASSILMRTEKGNVTIYKR